MLWELLAVVLALWFVHRRWMTRRQRALAKQLKTNIKTWPVIGHAHRFMGNAEEKMKNIIEDTGRDAIELGGITKMFLYDELMICVADPAIVEVVMNKCLEKHTIIKLLEFLLGSSSVIAPVPVWRQRRRKIRPFFKTKNIAKIFKIFSKHSATGIDLLEQETGKGTFSIWKYISTYGSNAFLETIMGCKMNDKSEDFMLAIAELWSFLEYAAFRPWFWPKILRYFMPSFKKLLQLRHTVWEFIRQNINEKRQLIELETNKCIKKDVSNTSFLDMQLRVHQNHRFADEEILEESITVFVAATDTLSICKGFVALILSRHHDVQDKVYKELQEVFAHSDRPICFEDLSRLQYLEAVIKETLRLYPPVPVLVRKVDKDVELPSGITLVEGCCVMVNIWAVHRNPAYWGADADQFRPERFLNYTPKHPAAFMAFSYGQRDCIGSQLAMTSMKTVLATILRRYRILPPPGVRQGDPLKTEFKILMRHAENYRVQLERRK